MDERVRVQVCPERECVVCVRERDRGKGGERNREREGGGERESKRRGWG